MTKTQRDLLAAVYNKHMKAEYEPIQKYAALFKKYDSMRMSEIDQVVSKLLELYRQDYK